MQLWYGPTGFPVNGVGVSYRREPIEPNGILVGFNKIVEVKGWILGSSTQDVVGQVLTLEAALNRPYQDLRLLDDQGNPTDVQLLNANSRGGVRVTKGLSRTEWKNAELVNQRYIECEFQSEEPIGNAGTTVIEFSEQIVFSGGGARAVMRESINTSAQFQIVNQFLAYRALITGHAVGYLFRPTPPPPLWPDSLLEPGDFTLVSPKRLGNSYKDLAASWSYKFAAVNPLIGFPRLWL